MLLYIFYVVLYLEKTVNPIFICILISRVFLFNFFPRSFPFNPTSETTRKSNSQLLLFTPHASQHIRSLCSPTLSFAFHSESIVPTTYSLTLSRFRSSCSHHRKDSLYSTSSIFPPASRKRASAITARSVRHIETAFSTSVYFHFIQKTKSNKSVFQPTRNVRKPDKLPFYYLF